MNKETKFKVGDKAHKPKGYKFPCTIVGVFETINGDIRVVGEMDEYGLLHIFNENQLEHYGKDEPDLLNEAYKNYFIKKSSETGPFGIAGIIPTKEEFIYDCKTDPEFSEKWGLTIEERKLNLDERAKLHPNPENFYDIHGTFSISDSIEDSNFPDKDWLHEQFDKHNIPTKLITIKYNDKTIESYE
jgi:hypothetical protein